MKPLLAKDLANFTSRFANFVDAEIRSFKIISPSVIQAIIACQDSSRGYDWLTLNIEFSTITDAKIIEDAKLSLIDMSDGLSIIFQENSFAFALGKYNNISGIKNALCYIISSNIKYEEQSF
jgi:hypothetical protein